MYEGLTASSPDGEVIPASATSWQVSDDGKTYVFQLRRDAQMVQWGSGDGGEFRRRLSTRAGPSHELGCG